MKNMWKLEREAGSGGRMLTNERKIEEKIVVFYENQNQG